MSSSMCLVEGVQFRVYAVQGVFSSGFPVQGCPVRGVFSSWSLPKFSLLECWFWFARVPLLVRWRSGSGLLESRGWFAGVLGLLCWVFWSPGSGLPETLVLVCWNAGFRLLEDRFWFAGVLNLI